MIIAGPCSIETYDRAMRDAEQLSALGIHYFRGGAFKPRTSPNDFQGHQEKGIEILNTIKEQTGMKIVTELVDSDFLPLYDNVDIIQIGSRNCQNFELLKKVGKLNRPVLLKRGFGMTIQEFISAANYLKEYGTDEKNIILCERGIRTFETATRNTLDIAAIPIVHQQTNYKIIVDPSHAAGRRDLIIPFSCAAMAAGADGLIVVCTGFPDLAYTDSKQQINYETMGCLLQNIKN